MANSTSKLDQALQDLIEAYAALEEEIDERCGEDEEAFATSLIEALEASIDTAVEACDVDTHMVANMISALSEAMESLDPDAFDGEESDDEFSYGLGESEEEEDLEEEEEEKE